MTTSLVLVIETGIVLSLCLVVLLTLRRRLSIPARAFQLLVVAFLARVVTALGIENAGTVFGQVDFYRFDQTLWQAALLFREGTPTGPLVISAQQGGDLFYIPYTLLYAPVYTVFGHETLLARIVFSLVGTLFVFNVYRLGKSVDDETVGLYAAGFAAFFPYWLYLSTIFYRDMLIMLVLSQLLLLVIRSGTSRTAIASASVVGLSVLAIVLRPENMLTVGVLGGIYTYQRLEGMGTLMRTLSMGTVVSALTGVLLWEYANWRVIDRLNFVVEQLSTGGGVYLDTIRYSNWYSVVSFVPVGAVYFLLVPFPNQIHNVLSLIAVLENLFIWYPTVLIGIIGLPSLVSRNRFIAFVLVAFVLSGIVPYGLLERNMGPALRHRSQFQVAFVLLAAVTIVERFEFQRVAE